MNSRIACAFRELRNRTINMNEYSILRIVNGYALSNVRVSFKFRKKVKNSYIKKIDGRLCLFEILPNDAGAKETFARLTRA
jgi:hypothetical protein